MATEKERNLFINYGNEKLRYFTNYTKEYSPMIYKIMTDIISGKVSEEEMKKILKSNDLSNSQKDMCALAIAKSPNLSETLTMELGDNLIHNSQIASYSHMLKRHYIIGALLENPRTQQEIDFMCKNFPNDVKRALNGKIEGEKDNTYYLNQKIKKMSTLAYFSAHSKVLKYNVDIPQSNIEKLCTPFLRKKSLRNSFFQSPFMYLKDNDLAKYILEGSYCDEFIRSSFVANRNLSEDIRNRSFDEGIDLRATAYCPTPYILDSIYRILANTCADAVSINPDSIKEMGNDEKSVYNDAIGLLVNYLKRNVLTENMQIDLYNRLIQFKMTKSNNIREALFKHTNVPEILENAPKIINNKSELRAFCSNKNISFKNVEEIISPIINKLSSNPNRKLSAKELNAIYSVLNNSRIVLPNEYYETLAKARNPLVAEYLSFSINTPSKILDDIIESNSPKGYVFGNHEVFVSSNAILLKELKNTFSSDIVCQIEKIIRETSVFKCLIPDITNENLLYFPKEVWSLPNFSTHLDDYRIKSFSLSDDDVDKETLYNFLNNLKDKSITEPDKYTQSIYSASYLLLKQMFRNNIPETQGIESRIYKIFDDYRKECMNYYSTYNPIDIVLNVDKYSEQLNDLYKEIKSKDRLFKQDNNVVETNKEKEFIKTVEKINRNFTPIEISVKGEEGR